MANKKDLAVSSVKTQPSPTTSGTSLGVLTGHGTRFPAAPFYATVLPSNTLPTLDNAEIVSVTAISGDNLTIVRAQKGTTAKAISKNWVIYNGIYVDDIPTSLPPTGPAGGDLSGTYPNPTVPGLATKQPNLTLSAQSSNFTAASGYIYTVDASAGNRTVTVPTSSAGQQFAVKKIDSSNNIVTINVSPAITLRLTNEAKVFIPDGSGGWIAYSGDLSLSQLDKHYLTVYNVREYGAVADGVTDDHLAIQKAINAATSGGIVYLPPGVYAMSAGISFGTKKITFMGAGRQATFLRAVVAFNGFSMVYDYTAGLSDIKITGITFDGAGYDGSGGIQLGQCNNVRIWDCEFTGVGYTSHSSWPLRVGSLGADITGTASYDVVVENCNFHDNNAGTFEILIGVNIRNSAFQDNYFANNTTSAYYANFYGYCNGSIISNNSFYGQGQAIGVLDSDTFEIHSNVISATGAFTGIKINNSEHWSIKNNIMTGTIHEVNQGIFIADHGASFDGNAAAYPYTRYGQIQDNYIYNVYQAVQIASAGTSVYQSSDIRITDNFFYNVEYICIGIGSNNSAVAIQNIDILDNYLWSSQMFDTGAIEINGYTSDITLVKNINIRGNKIIPSTRSNAAGIHLNACSGINVINNDMVGTDKGTLAGQPIYLTNGATTNVANNNTGVNPEKLYALGSVSSTVTFNRQNGNVQSATLTGNITATLTNGLVSGDTLALILTQDGTGSRTATWPANSKNGPVLNTAASAVDVIIFVWDGTNWNANKPPAFTVSPPLTLTAAVGANYIPLTVNQNDTTNNPDGMVINNSTSGSGLIINQTGSFASGKRALQVISNSALTSTRPLVGFKQGNASTTDTTVLVEHAGSGKAIDITNSHATYSGAAANVLRIGNSSGSINALTITATNSGAGAAVALSATGQVNMTDNSSNYPLTLNQQNTSGTTYALQAQFNGTTVLQLRQGSTGGGFTDLRLTGQSGKAAIISILDFGGVKYGDITYDGNNMEVEVSDGDLNLRTGAIGGVTIGNVNVWSPQGNIKFRVADQNFVHAIDMYHNGTNGVIATQSGMGDIILSPNGNVQLSSKRITNMADPTGAQDAATKNYVDARVGADTLDYVAKTANYTATSTDTIIDCISGTFTVTVPTAVGVTGKMYVVKNSGSGTITIGTTSAQTIDGSTTATLSVQYTALTLVSNGANWIII